MPFPTRMTVVRLASGGLWLHSPTQISDGLRAELDALGPVRHLVSPNRIHYSHMLSWTYTQVYNDIKKCSDTIKAYGGGTPKYYRCPYLEENSTIQSVCSALGLTIIRPTVDSKDWNGATTDQIISNCNALASGGNPLMHDGYTTTDNAIITVITNARNRGLYTSQY